MKRKVLSLILILLLVASVFTGCSCKHEYVSIITKEATCSTEGVRTITCTKCGDAYTEVISTKAHNYDGEATIVKEATCSEEGEMQYKCLICGYIMNEVLSSNGHDWEDATCTKPETCSICKETVGLALGHSCNVGQCSRCNQSVGPKVTLLTKTPATFSYIGGSGNVYAKARYSDVSLKVNNEGVLYIEYIVEKIYDISGRTATNKVGFEYILKDADGFIIQALPVVNWNLRIGDKKKEDGCYIAHLDLSYSKGYTIELLDCGN